MMQPNLLLSTATCRTGFTLARNCKKPGTLVLYPSGPSLTSAVRHQRNSCQYSAALSQQAQPTHTQLQTPITHCC